MIMIKTKARDLGMGKGDTTILLASGWGKDDDVYTE